MPISISEHVGIDSKVFDRTGAFDAILDVDSKLFIDPHLLKTTKAPELAKSYQKLTKTFEEILHILAKCVTVGDVFWREALRRFDFPEFKGLCIGYASKGTSGSGMTGVLRTNILKTAKAIVEAGINDPEIFELIGLFEEKVGPDRISDMVGRIIRDDLLAYTGRVLSDLSVKTKVTAQKHRTVINPFNNRAVVLLPKDILRDLPIARSWSEIDLVCAHNRELRRKVNELIGDTWKKATKVHKSKLRSVLIAEPEVMQDLINLYRNKPAEEYDFENDPAGQVNWLPASRKFVLNYPLKITLPTM